MTEHTNLRRRVRDFATRVLAPRAAEVDRTAEYPWDVHQALREVGLLGLHVPRDFGGVGADDTILAVVVEELSRVDASTGLVVAVNKLGTTPLMTAASDGLKQRFLPDVASGAATYGYALSERQAGSDAAAMETRAERSGDHFVLNGTKAWISQAGVATHYTVLAVTDPGQGTRGISAFVVRADDPGVVIGPPARKLGLHGSPTCEVSFVNCRIPSDRMIGAQGTGFRTALRTLDQSRLIIGAQAVGIAQGAIDVAVGYLRERRQFGHPLADFQGLQFMLADMAMQTEAARRMVEAAAVVSATGGDGLTFSSAAAKCFASDTALAVTADAVQLLGGVGYTDEYAVERMMRDAKATQIYEGTNQVLRAVMAREVLRGPLD
jgi:alkylation response protein AidB-like acyl-CoA dehydrogenase